MNEEPAVKRLFVDMDGTISRFHNEAGCISGYRREGFFANLKPYPEMLRAISILMSRNISVTVLSTVPLDNFGPAIEEKKQWLKKQFSDIGQPVPAAAFVAGQSKVDFVLQEHKTLQNAFLLDDYSVNLADFRSGGGTGIKALNELNGRGWNNVNWDGPEVYCMDAAEHIADNICRIMNAGTTGKGKNQNV